MPPPPAARACSRTGRSTGRTAGDRCPPPRATARGPRGRSSPGASAGRAEGRGTGIRPARHRGPTPRVRGAILDGAGAPPPAPAERDARGRRLSGGMARGSRMDDDLEGPALSRREDPEGLGELLEGEPVGDE